MMPRKQIEEVTENTWMAMMVVQKLLVEGFKGALLRSVLYKIAHTFGEKGFT